MSLVKTKKKAKAESVTTLNDVPEYATAFRRLVELRKQRDDATARRRDIELNTLTAHQEGTDDNEAYKMTSGGEGKKLPPGVKLHKSLGTEIHTLEKAITLQENQVKSLNVEACRTVRQAHSSEYEKITKQKVAAIKALRDATLSDEKFRRDLSKRGVRFGSPYVDIVIPGFEKTGRVSLVRRLDEAIKKAERHGYA